MIRNDTEANIKFYRVVRVISQIYIHININDSKLSLRKLNNLLKMNDFSL